MSCLRAAGLALIICWLIFFGYMITREATEESFKAINRDGRVSQCDQDLLKKLRTAQLKIEEIQSENMNSQRTISDLKSALDQSPNGIIVQTEMDVRRKDELDQLNDKIQQQQTLIDSLKRQIESIKSDNDQNRELSILGKTNTVSSMHFTRTKSALKWHLRTAEEERDNALKTFLKNTELLKKDFLSETGTSFSCYELSDEPRVNVFTRLSAGSVCVFENICYYSESFWVIFDENSHPTFQMSPGQSWDWPQTLNGYGPRVHAKKVPNAHEYFQSKNIQWEDRFSWLITNSYSSHTAHWFETISQVFLAQHLLSKDTIPEAEAVYFTTHGQNMFDWQVGTLLSSLNQENKPQFYYPDSLGFSDGSPKCFKKAAIPGYQFYFFPSQATGTAYKFQTYSYLQLPLPSVVPRVVTIASRGGKRSIANQDKLIEYLENFGKGIFEVKVVKFGSMTFKEQVASMHGTGLLIGIHGADLTNEMFLPNGAAIMELNPYRFYDNRFFGIAPLTGIKYFSYNCGKSSCSANGGSQGVVNIWPISGYPPIQEPLCNKDIGSVGMRDSNLIVDFQDFEIVLKEVMSYLGWADKNDLSTWT